MSNAPAPVMCKECIHLYMLVSVPIVPVCAPAPLNAEKLQQPPTPPLEYDVFKPDM